MKETTTRHSMIQNLRVEVIEKHRRINENEMLVNRTIDLTRFKETSAMRLEKENALQRSGI
jgi:hypothetical protein